MTMARILSDVTREMLESWGTPYEINNGGCEEWADTVLQRLSDSPHAVEVWATPYFFADTTHSFVRIDGLFYDAECPEGADDHMDLPIFRRLTEAGRGRQPVWRENANRRGGLSTESLRDFTPELRRLVREEQIEAGVDPEEALSAT